jgi:hypothetical protein
MWDLTPEPIEKLLNLGILSFLSRRKSWLAKQVFASAFSKGRLLFPYGDIQAKA